MDMTYHFINIEAECHSGYVVLTAEDGNIRVLGQVTVHEEELEKLFPKEFQAQKALTFGGWYKETEYVPAGYNISLKEWFDEYLARNKRRMWYLWEQAPSDTITIIEE
jgi:hypothetical protein